MEKQVIIIYAATNGFLDAYPVADGRRYETELYRFLDLRHGALLQQLAEKKDLKGELDDKLKAALTEFADVFQVAGLSEGLAGRERAHARPRRHPPPDPQRQEHAADHQGHEDGLRGQAAPRAGGHVRGASLRAEDDGGPEQPRHPRQPRRRTRCSRSAASTAC